MRLFITTLSRLPLPLLYVMASACYYLSYYLLRYRRRVVRNNLLRAFPEKALPDIVAIEKRFYRFFCDSAFEVIKGITMPASELERRVHFENPELLKSYLEREESLLFLSLHQGNPEWITQALGHFLPCSLAGIYKPLHNKTMNQLVLETRSRHGIPVAIKSSAREILKMRKQFRCLVMFADQSPISREKRYWQRFFKQPAPFYLGPQTIAESTGKPVIFMHNRLTKRGHYSIRFEVIAEPPYEKGGHEVLDRYIAALEETIRGQPESWWWSNKKWKSPKPGELEAAGLV